MKSIIVLILALVVVVSAEGQVKLKLDYDQTQGLASVRAVPEQTVDFPREILGSMQVTFRVLRSSQFSLGTVFSDISNVSWMRNNTLDNINYSDEYVYYTLGVEPIGRSLQLVKDQEVGLFSFAADDLKLLELLDSSDPIIKRVESGLSLDIANNISIATTMGVHNAYSGNIKAASLNAEEVQSLSISKVYPNPGAAKIQVSWTNFQGEESNQGAIDLYFIEPATGRTVKSHKMSNTYGLHTEEVDVSSLNQGSYILKIGEGNRSVSEGVLFNKNN